MNLGVRAPFVAGTSRARQVRRIHRRGKPLESNRARTRLFPRSPADPPGRTAEWNTKVPCKRPHLRRAVGMGGALSYAMAVSVAWSTRVRQNTASRAHRDGW